MAIPGLAVGVVATAMTVTVLTAHVGPLTVWDGVYTADQARRGARVYAQACSGCHRPDLGGGPEGEPPLRGPVFTSNWDGGSLAALFDTLRTTMPRTRPGSLAPSAYADVLGFLLQSNGLPAGMTELPVDLAVLDAIAFTQRP